MIAPLVLPVLLVAFIAGWAGQSWLLVPLAIVPALFAIPFGYADQLGEDFLLWSAELAYTTFYAVLMAAGIIARRATLRRR